MKKFLNLGIYLLFISTAFSQVKSKEFNLEKGLAIQGYDPVSYFTQKAPVKGNRQYAVNSAGAVYYFSTQGNKDLFLKNPAAYEPQYGGWCAYAMGASGEKVEIDPETFKIVQGKLYLFYHSWTNNTLTKWNKDEDNLRRNAEKNWQKFVH
jgi:YHS domain-containing protein